MVKMNYPGGKNGQGSFQQIIYEIPLHRVYIELFAGSAAVYRNKLSAELCYLVDREENVLQGYAKENVHCIVGGALEFLDWYEFVGDEFIYADPPYLFSTRRSGWAGIYKYEFGTQFEHKQLLGRLRRLPCAVAISTYENWLYAAMLDRWRLKKWSVRTRKGEAVECLYMNYEIPALLHDGRYVGSDYIQRQRFRRLAGVEAR
jgi:site-specific DNA-adenine methylase